MTLVTGRLDWQGDAAIAALRPGGELMQEGDDVEVARMREDVQTRLLKWGHDLQQQAEHISGVGVPASSGSLHLQEHLVSASQPHVQLPPVPS